MKSIGKAAELVSKAVGALRRKAGVLRARLLFLMASPRRRAAVLAGISRHIRALTTTTTPRQPCHEKAPAAQHYCRDAACRPLAPADHDDDDDEGVVVAAGGLPVVAPASSLLLLLVVQAEGDGDDGDGGCTADWTLALRSLFDDEVDGHGRGGGDDCLAAAMDGLVVAVDDDDETSSVLDVIRRRREGDGQEFRIEDEIDRAAGMYITRVRRRMSAQLLKMTSY